MYKIILTTLLLVMILPLTAGNKKLTNLSDENFKKEVLDSNQIVLVDFWAPWCAPCKKLGPIIEELANKNDSNIKFTKLNVDNNQRIAGAYGIKSIPTVAIFKGGKPIDGFVGLRSKSEIESLLKKHMKIKDTKIEVKSTKKPIPVKK
jgi:thioredoxin 1